MLSFPQLSPVTEIIIIIIINYYTCLLFVSVGYNC